MKHLARLPVLRRLILHGTPLDDTAVASLKLLTSLRILHVRDTKLTAAGIQELQRALPKCAIFWNGGLLVPGATPGNVPVGKPATTGATKPGGTR